MRLAASTYLNSAPLVYSFSTGSQHGRAEFLGHEAPSRCAALLSSGSCEAALIPAIEYQRQPGVGIVAGVSVASKTRVRSVVLVSRVPIERAEHVSLDASSRTSQALVQILCRDRYGSRPILSERPRGSAVDLASLLESHDAALVIGDPAMQLDSGDHRSVHIYDLAEEWRALTGRPFVFALWAVRLDLSPQLREQVPDFVAAKREGLSHIDEIADRYAVELGLPVADVQEYLHHNVNYDLDDENLSGLQEFYERAQRCGIIDRVRPMAFA
jgi:chorismate dehydratase